MVTWRQLQRPLQTPGLSVRTQTLGAAVAPPAGGAGVVRGEAADAAEVPGGQRGGRGRRGQVVGLRLLRQVLLLQQRGEVFPETLLEVIAPRLPLLLLWFFCLAEGGKAGSRTWGREGGQRVVLEVVFLQSLELSGQSPLSGGFIQNSALPGLHPSGSFLFQHHLGCCVVASSLRQPHRFLPNRTKRVLLYNRTAGFVLMSGHL